VREIRNTRQRSTGWWAVFLLACLALAIYIAFDLLDLDASNLRDRGAAAAIAAVAPSAETDRLLSHRLSTGGAQGPVAIHPESLLTSDLPQLLFHGSLDGTIARRGGIRPRAHLSCDTSSAGSLIGDPA
jgi:hypothetical protein